MATYTVVGVGRIAINWMVSFRFYLCVQPYKLFI